MTERRETYTRVTAIAELIDDPRVLQTECVVSNTAPAYVADGINLLDLAKSKLTDAISHAAHQGNAKVATIRFFVDENYEPSVHELMSIPHD